MNELTDLLAVPPFRRAFSWANRRCSGNSERPYRQGTKHIIIASIACKKEVYIRAVGVGWH